MKNLLFKCLAVVLLLAAQGFEVTVWAQTVSNPAPPREQWTQIFEKNYANPDKVQSRIERRVWSAEMDEEYDDWLDKKMRESERQIAVNKARADESERQIAVHQARLEENDRQYAVNKARADESERLANYAKKLGDTAALLTEIVNHWTKFGDQRNSERLQLENRIQNNEMLMKSGIMSKHVMDYINGKPFTLEYLQAMQKWITENKENRFDRDNK